jgi:hypothetical protein
LIRGFGVGVWSLGFRVWGLGLFGAPTFMAGLPEVSRVQEFRRFRSGGGNHTVEYKPFIQSQLASRN